MLQTSYRSWASIAFALALGMVATGVASDAGAREHVLRFANGQSVSHLDSLLVDSATETYPGELTGAYLARVDAHHRLVPELAIVVPSLANGGVSRDGKTIDFHLRRNLRWSDGMPLTARDVVFTTRLIIAKNSPVGDRTGWARIAGVSERGTDVVRFRLDRPYAAAPSFFSTRGTAYAILPEHALRGVVDLRSAPYNALPIGAGPFRYRRFQRNERIVMEANPFYFRGRPKLDRLVFEMIPNENAVATAFMTGNLDLMMQSTRLQRRRVAATSLAVRRVSTPSTDVSFLVFNVTRSLVNDRVVRQAIRYAIDRNSLRRLASGIDAVSDDPVSTIDPFAERGFGSVAYDPKRAAAMLDAAGWRANANGLRERDGKRLSLEILTPGNSPTAGATTELVRAQLANVGITVESRVLQGAYAFAPDGPILTGAFTSMLVSAQVSSDGLAAFYACAARPPAGTNFSRYCNRDVDAALERADTTFDEATRRRDYLAARRAIATDVPAIPLGHHGSIDVLRAGVTGYRPNGETPFDDAMDLDVAGH